MKPTKIIHILSHGPPASIYSSSSKDSLIPEHHVKVDRPPYWFGFWRENFFVAIAEEITKRSNKFALNECWRPYLGCEKIYSKTIEGVTHRIFPSFAPKKIQLKREHVIIYERSPLMISKLQEEMQNYNVILHFHGFPGGGPTRDILKKLNLKDVPVVVQHRGGSFKFERRKYRSPNLFMDFLSEIYKLIEYREAKSFYSNNVDIFLSLSLSELRTFQKMGLRPTLYLKDGTNFSDFHVADKFVVREKLNLPLDGKIMLFVGNFTRVRGINKILKVYNILKKKYNINLIAIGGYESDEYYSQVVNSGAIFIGRIAREKLVPYYQASDLTIAIDPHFIYNYGGISFVPIEGMACGTPSVSRSIVNFIGTKQESSQIGEIPSSDSLEEVTKCVIRILENPAKYSGCRNITKKYYSRDVVIKKNLKIYDYLSYKYYGK